MGLAEFTVAFREIFEIALILGVMQAYLRESGQRTLISRLWAGALAAGLASLLAAGAFSAILEGWQGGEQLFEGVTLLLASAMVSGLILSMIGKKSMARSLHEGIERHMKTTERSPPRAQPFRSSLAPPSLSSKAASFFASWGLAIFAFAGVLREGMEIVLFFAGIRMASGGLELGAALAGAIAALALAWALFRAIISFDAGHFLRLSALLLILLAGGLAGMGVHELQEAHMVPEALGTAYNINPPAPDGGPYPLLHEKGLAGAVLKSVLGVPFSPSWEQLGAQGIYLGGMFMLYGRAVGEKR